MLQVYQLITYTHNGANYSSNRIEKKLLVPLEKNFYFANLPLAR